MTTKEPLTSPGYRADVVAVLGQMLAYARSVRRNISGDLETLKDLLEHGADQA